jgi:hypothetical protein
MAEAKILCIEEVQSRTVNYGDSSIFLRYKLIKKPIPGDRQPIDYNKAYIALIKKLPLSLNIDGVDDDLVPGQDIELESDTKYSYIAKVPYRLIGVPELGQPFPKPEEIDRLSNVGNLSFTSSAETKHVVLAIDTVKRNVAPGVTPTDYKNVIGLDQDNNPTGTEIPSNKLSWSETHYRPLGFVTHEYVNKIGRVVGRVNKKAFRQKPPHSVICMSVHGSINWTELRWDLTFNFDYSAPEDAVTIGDMLPFSVRGYDYIDVHYEVQEDTAGKRTIAKPIQADVLQVIKEGDYEDLGIGVQ